MTKIASTEFATNFDCPVVVPDTTRWRRSREPVLGIDDSPTELKMSTTQRKRITTVVQVFAFRPSSITTKANALCAAAVAPARTTREQPTERVF